MHSHVTLRLRESPLDYVFTNHAYCNSRTFKATVVLISRVEVADSLVAFTIDDSPTLGHTDEIFKTLDIYNIQCFKWSQIQCRSLISNHRLSASIPGC